MDRYLLTHSLMSAWLYLLKDNPYAVDFDDDGNPTPPPMDDFMRTLNREPSIPNEAMQKGIDFEQLVTDIIYGKADPSAKWYEPAAEFAGIVKGGLLQYAVKKETEVNGFPLLLFGRLDALKAGVVYDIKCVKSSKNYENGKYIDSSQHPMYMELVPEAYKFTYLVSDGNSAWYEEYLREDVPSIYPIIEQFLSWLDNQGLMTTYQEKWPALK